MPNILRMEAVRNEWHKELGELSWEFQLLELNSLSKKMMCAETDADIILLLKKRIKKMRSRKFIPVPEKLRKWACITYPEVEELYF